MPIVARPSRAQSWHDRPAAASLARFVDRWIYVVTAASFIVIALAGFVPDSLTKIAAVGSAKRPPFPAVMHVHAVLMASFLLLLLTQTWLAATGRIARHRRLGMLAAVLVPAIVATGVILVPTIYHETLHALQTAPPGMRAKLQTILARKENIALVQLRMGILFPLFLVTALVARSRDPSFHKRMILLATVVLLPPAIDRIEWLPSTFPASFVATECYVLLAIAPLFVWDVWRSGHVHRAYLVWLAISAPFAVALHALWDTPWWHATARVMLSA